MLEEEKQTEGSDELQDAIANIARVLKLPENRIVQLSGISNQLLDKNNGRCLDALVEADKLEGFTSLERLFIGFHIASIRAEYEIEQMQRGDTLLSPDPLPESPPTIDTKNPLKAVELNSKREELLNNVSDVKFTIDELFSIDDALREYFNNHKDDESHLMQNKTLPRIVSIDDKIQKSWDNSATFAELNRVLELLDEYNKYDDSQRIKAREYWRQILLEKEANPDKAFIKMKRNMSRTLKIKSQRLDYLMELSSRLFYASDNMAESIVIINKLRKISTKERILLGFTVGSRQTELMYEVINEMAQKRETDCVNMFV